MSSLEEIEVTRYRHENNFSQLDVRTVNPPGYDHIVKFISTIDRHIDIREFERNVANIDNITFNHKTVGNKISIPINGIVFNFDLKVNATNSIKLVFTNCKIKKITLSECASVDFVGCTIDEIFIHGTVFGLYSKDCEILSVNCLEGTIIKSIFLGKSIQRFAIPKNRMISFLLLSEISVGFLSAPSCQIEDSLFHKISFLKAPNFISGNISKTVHFENCTSEEISRTAGAYYKELRALCLGSGDDVSASQFNAYYLLCRHKYLNRTEDQIDWILSSCYKFINVFGLRVYRPGFLILLVFIAMTIIFSALAISENLYQPVQSDHISNLVVANENCAFKVLYLAFVSAIGPFRVLNSYSQLNPTTIIGNFSLILGSTISSILWFFLILGIRKRFTIRE